MYPLSSSFFKEKDEKVVVLPSKTKENLCRGRDTQYLTDTPPFKKVRHFGTG